MKRRMLRIASGLTILGTVFLGVAIGCVVGFLSSFLYGSAAALIASAAVLGSIAVLWYAIPLRLRHGPHR